MKTVILDDDPTGTQSAGNVVVLLEHSTELIADALRDAESVYIQTNSRAIDVAGARALARRIRAEALEAGQDLGHAIQFVLRGDSTLRGHVFEETEEFLDPEAVILFVPAFPAGGRTTEGGVHYVSINGVTYPADQTEYAADPVFPFSTAVLCDYVTEKSGRTSVLVELAAVRRPGELTRALAQAAPGSVICPDAVTDDDIRLIARDVQSALTQGTKVVVRSAAPLAAVLAGVESTELLPAPLAPHAGRTLLVCGSHTAGATRQLKPLVDSFGVPHTISTVAALEDPAGTGEAIAAAVRQDLDRQGLAILVSERNRSTTHNSLDHGERIMKALTTAVENLRDDVDVVVAKGGITSAEVIRTGLGIRRALVRGQVLPGVSVWDAKTPDGHEILYVVVPGNVGEDDTLSRILGSVTHAEPRGNGQ